MNNATSTLDTEVVGVGSRNPSYMSGDFLYTNGHSEIGKHKKLWKYHHTHEFGSNRDPLFHFLKTKK